MTSPAAGRHRDPERREQESLSSEAYIDSALNRLSHVPVPSGLKDRVEARLTSAKLPGGVPVTSQWNRAAITASVLVTTVAVMALITYQPGAVHPGLPIPAVLPHVAPTGLNAAGAVRIPTRAMGVGRVTEVRAGHPPGSGRHTLARHVVLPHGVAIPRHPVPESSVNKHDGVLLPQGSTPH